MYKKSDLRHYQEAGARWIVDNKAAAMWMDVGTGKTITSLSAIEELLDRCEVYGVLVVAPKRVAESVWQQDAVNFEHTKHLTFSKILGSPTKRKQALMKRAQVYLVNYENLPWLADQVLTVYIKRGRLPPFNMIVFDELSKMANSQSKRVKAFLKMFPYTDRRIGLTGTPATRGLLKLFGQYLCLDGGVRLGTGITNFRNVYFESDYMGYTWTPKKGADKKIQAKIQDITYQISAADYLDLPEIVFNDIWIDLPEKHRKVYEELEREFFATIDGENVEVFSESSLQNKLLQICNGAYYPVVGGAEFEEVHDLKLEALDEIVEEMGGAPLLVSYNYKSDLARMQQQYKKQLTCVKSASADVIVSQWNAGEIEILAGHPASMGHGLNLQHGSNHLVMFGLNWDLELYEQVLGRLHRSGQTKTVFVHRIMVRNSIEEAVLASLEGKAKTQEELRDAIKQYQLRRAI